jgi:hypothetical protein
LGFESQVDGRDLMAGVVLAAGSQSQDVLVRALGPSLGTGGLADPRLALRTAAGTLLAENDDWSGDAAGAAATTLVGAPPLPLGSRDSALLRSLTPGSFTVHIGGGSGRARVEIYALPKREFHVADVNRDGRLNLFELTRVIELFNTRHDGVRTGGYTLAETATEDGFVADLSNAATAVVALARYHTADTNRDGRIGLLELTRVIELYNYRSGGSRTGQYKPKSGTEDGFDPGP